GQSCAWAAPINPAPTMSGAKSLAIVLTCRAMVAFPAVSAPRPPIAARIACRMLDSLAHHSGKRNWACAMRHGLRQMTVKLQRPAACRLEMVQDLTSGASQRTGRDQQNCV